MNYDFMMFKPRGAVSSMSDLGAANLSPQDGEAIKARLTALFPAIEWEDKEDRGWVGRLLADGSAYEFRIHAGEDECWTISTPEDNHDTPVIGKICSALQVLAFDGQALELVDDNGRRPALAE
jgi:hypothetical protein